MKHFDPTTTTKTDPIIDGYIQMLRYKYLEFSKTSASPDAQAKLPLSNENPKYYMLTTRYNHPFSKLEDHEFKVAGQGQNVDTQSHLELELDFRQSIQYVHKNSTLLHNHICNKTVKNHFRPKNLKFLPLGFSFIDFSGSRSGYFKLNKLPHTHAIYLVHPQMVASFETFAENKAQLEGVQSRNHEEFYGRYCNTRNIQEVDIREIPNTRKDLYRVLSYSSKFHSSKLNQRLEYDIRCLSFDVFNKLR